MPGNLPPATPDPQDPQPHTDPASLRVALVSDAIANRNGVGVYYYDLAEHLRDRVGRVELICPSERNQGLCQSYSLAMPGDASQRLHLPHIRRHWQTMHQLRPHAVVVGTPGPFGILGLMFARRLKARIYAGFHTDFDRLTELYWRGLIGRICQTPLRAAHRWLFRAAHAVLTTSDEMALAARKSGAKRVELMGTPVFRPLITTPITQPRRELRSILFAGRLAPEKNIEAILEAAERLPHRRFIIAGDGPKRPVVEEAAQRLDNVEYAGWVNREEILPLLDAADLLVLPSSIESFGIIAMEAMVRARCVLVSEACGIATWRELADGLHLLQRGEHVADGIERLAALPAEDLQAKAHHSRTAAVAASETALDQWVNLLADGIAQPAPLTDPVADTDAAATRP